MTRAATSWNGVERRTRVRHFIKRRFDDETFLGLELTVTLLVAGGAIWIFGALLDAVLDNATMVRWDIGADGWIHNRVTTTGLAIFQKISEIGSPTTMTVLCVIGAILLARRHQMLLLVTWIAAFAGSGILGRVVKAAVHRGRPSFGIAFLTDDSYSFPSGHSAGAFVGIGMLLFVLVKLDVLRGKWLLVSMAAGATFVVLVGVSRVYLGVHYPSDVVGGFAVSAAWMAVCTTVSGIVMHHRGRSPRSARAVPGVDAPGTVATQ